MEPPQNPGSKPLDHLPQELLRRINADVPAEQVQLCVPYDLDAAGRYSDGYLVLVNGRVGDFHRRDGRWDARWFEAERVKEAKIVEGLGMGLLRLSAEGKALAEFRFTLRHAKAVAKFQRTLERRISGKADEAEPDSESRKPDEKKLRCDKCGRVIPPWTEYCPACMSRRKVLSRLFDFARPYRARAVFGVTLAVVATLVGLVRPALTKPMLNDGLGLAHGRTADYGVLLFYVGLLALVTISTAGMDALRHQMMALLGSRVSRDIRDRTYAHLHKLSLSFFSRKPTGTLVTRITSDSDRIWDFVAWTIIEFTVSVLTILGVCGMLFVMNWKLACFVFVPIPIMAVLTFVFHTRLHFIFDRLFHRWSLLTAVVADALPGVRVIKAFSQEKREVDRFSQRNAAFYADEVGAITLWTLFGPTLHFCSQIGSLIVWTIGGYWTVRGWMDPGTLMAFVGYMWMFYSPIHMLAHMDRMLNRAASSVHRIFEVLDTEPAIFSKSGADRVSKLRGKIELRDMSFSYDGIRKVLKNINLTIEPGRMVGLAGPSGGGKTTMVNLICRFYDVLDGRILIDDVDVRDYDVESLRRKIGVVLQEPFLFHGTVAENIAYGRPEATIDEIIEAARAANAHDFIVGFPDGYDTQVGERGHTLSGGERQRISIARAILNDPTILILDEATSSVDTETEKLIQEAIGRLISNRTTIAIAHRLSTLRKAERLVILDKGEIVEQGSHDELADKDGGVYAKMLKAQSEMQSIIAIAG